MAPKKCARGDASWAAMKDHHLDPPAGEALARVKWSVSQGQDVEEGQRVGAAVTQAGATHDLVAPTSGTIWWICPSSKVRK